MILPSKNSQVLHTPDVDRNNAAFKDAMNDPASDKNKKNSKSICNVIKLVQGTFKDFNQGIIIISKIQLVVYHQYCVLIG